MSSLPESPEELYDALNAFRQIIAESSGDFPSKGKSWEELEAIIDEGIKMDTDEHHGKLTIYSLKGGDDVQQVIEKAWSKYFSRNALFGPGIPSLFKMEIEIGHWVTRLLGGGPDAQGFLTSGGTESIFCGLKSARDWAREHKPHITGPEMVVPESIHPAFNKAAWLLGIKEVRVPVAGDYRADSIAIEKAITPNTILMVGSAPCWPYGLYDDIRGLASIAREHDLWFHCDACVGGMLAPFVKELGYPVPDFNLSVPGVCSLSADLHKYGYAAKPASMVLYPDNEHSKYQLYVFADPIEGLYATMSFTGSRPGGAVAAAWTAINYLGREGYLRLAKRTMEVKEALMKGINAIEGLSTWDTDLSLLLFGSTGFDILAVSAGMVERGWFVMGIHQPEMFHMTVDPIGEVWIETYLKNLREVVELVRAGKITGEKGKLGYL